MRVIARAILRHLELLGYAVTAGYHAGGIELRAEKDGERYVARCLNGDMEGDVYRAACLLAAAVGVDVEDG